MEKAGHGEGVMRIMHRVSTASGIKERREDVEKKQETQEQRNNVMNPV